LSVEQQPPDPPPTFVDVTFYEVVSRREQLLERVQVVAQRIMYRVRRAVIHAAPDTRSDPPDRPSA
jgi:hypothetical protein